MEVFALCICVMHRRLSSVFHVCKITKFSLNSQDCLVETVCFQLSVVAKGKSYIFVRNSCQNEQMENLTFSKEITAKTGGIPANLTLN